MEELLKKILEELQFHGKLLTSMVEMMDGGKHDNQEKKIEVAQKLGELAEMMKGSPVAFILKDAAKKMGGNHGR